MQKVLLARIGRDAPQISPFHVTPLFFYGPFLSGSRAFLNPEEWQHHGCVKAVASAKRCVRGALAKTLEEEDGLGQKDDSSSLEIYSCPLCQVLTESAIDLQKHLFDHVKNQCRLDRTVVTD